MDIDTIRELLRQGKYATTREFHRRGDRRGFSLSDAQMVVEVGSVIEERPDGKPCPKCTISGVISRDVAGVVIRDELHIAIALCDDVVFITGYWKNDRPRRRKVGK